MYPVYQEMIMVLVGIDLDGIPGTEACLSIDGGAASVFTPFPMNGMSAKVPTMTIMNARNHENSLLLVELLFFIKAFPFFYQGMIP